MTKPLFESSEWTYDMLKRMDDAIADIALCDLGLDIYPNQIEIVSAEQMLDMYASIGLPRMYRHWSFGKRFMQHEGMYRTGGVLAYELVINSVPCISYCMEQNTSALQALVIAHAAFGHNHFFKNNYLFLAGTDAEEINDYLGFARDYVVKCEERYGESEVEKLLDAAHALQSYGVFRYQRPHTLTERERREREEKLRVYREESFDSVMMTTIPNEMKRYWDSLKTDSTAAERLKKEMLLPEENLLYFAERYSPKLEEWQREVLRIVQYLAKYFYPQAQTKVMNEGCATFVHYYIMHALRRKGLITDGAMLEIIRSHAQVVYQRDFDDPHFSGINPYNLGWNMMREIARIVTGREVQTTSGRRLYWTVDPHEEGSVPCTEEQLEEDREWFPDIAGVGDWRDVLKRAWANYRDESFIKQYLSPKLMREKRMFLIRDSRNEAHIKVEDIADERGYGQIRTQLSREYEINVLQPSIEVENVDLFGDRKLYLRHTAVDRVPLHEVTARETLEYMEYLWGYPVSMKSVSEAGTLLSGTSRISTDETAKPKAKKDSASVV